MAIWSLLLIAMAVGTVLGQSNRTITQTEIDTIVSMHNSLRSAISPTATDMFRVYWDAELAASAQRYADSCPTAHSGWPNLGENLSWGWPTMTANDAVQEWIKEGPHYTFVSNTCAAGKVCAHYTQMIWNNSSKIGCGVRSCPNILGQPVADAWVCHYTVAGNVVGSKPYTVGGASCSGCPSSTVCMENLCSVPGTPSSPAAAQPGQPSPAAATPAAAQQAMPYPAGIPAGVPAAAAAGIPAAAAGAPVYAPAIAGAGGIPIAGGIPAAGAGGIPAAAPAIPAMASGIPAAAPAALPAAMPTVLAAPTIPQGAIVMPATMVQNMTAASLMKPNITQAPINESAIVIGQPLSPFTIVQVNKNKTAISIRESNVTTAPRSTIGPGNSKTIIGFQPRTFFG